MIAITNERWTMMDGPTGPVYYADIADMRKDPSDPWGRALDHKAMDGAYCDGELVEWRGPVNVDGETAVLVIVND